MNALQTKIAAARAANPARFKPGKPVAPPTPPYFNIWNCPVGRFQATPQGEATVGAWMADDLPF